MILRSTGTAIRALVADRASRLIAATGVSLIACLALLGAYLCIDLRDTAWRNAERNSDNLLVLIEEAVGRTVRNYNRSLLDTARRAAQPDIAALEPDLRRMAMFDTSTQSSGLGTVAVTDAAGQARITSDPNQRTLPDLGDLPDFEVHRTNPRVGLIVVGPVVSRFTGRRVVRMTHRIETPDGAFAGIVSGAIFLDYFQSLFERLHIEDGSTVNLFHRNGTLLVRAPFDPALAGRSIAGAPSYAHYRTHGRGRYFGRAGLDGAMRTYAFANLDDLSLIVTVAVSADSVRAAWMSKAVIVAALILCLSALILGLTVTLQRQVLRRAAEAATSREANAALSLLARTDGLTGLPNRRSYDEAIAAAWERAALDGRPLAMLIVDADRFKHFNDRFGHQRGDEVLRAVAGCLRDTIDGGGIACRLGGEEFAVILPGLDAQAAHRVAERVRRAVVNLQIAHAPEVGGVATVSIGLACASPTPGDAPDALFVAADAALYAAKSAGRNRVRSAPMEAGSPPTARCA